MSKEIKPRDSDPSKRFNGHTIRFVRVIDEGQGEYVREKRKSRADGDLLFRRSYLLGFAGYDGEACMPGQKTCQKYKTQEGAIRQLLLANNIERNPSRKKKQTRIPTPHAGALGGPGYTSKSAAERHRLIRKLYKKAGYAKTIGSLQSRANLLHRTSPAAAKVFETDVRWAQKNLEGTRNMKSKAEWGKTLSRKRPASKKPRMSAATKKKIAASRKARKQEQKIFRAEPVEVFHRKDGDMHVYTITAPDPSSGIVVIRGQAVSTNHDRAREDAIEAAEQELLEYYGEAGTQYHIDRLEKAMYKKRKLSRNKGKTMAKRNAKKKTKKRAKKKTSRPKGFGSSRQRSSVGRAAPGMKRRGITYRPAGFGTAGKKKSTKKKAKKKTAKRKTSKKKTAKKSTRKTQGKCLTQAQAKQMRKQIAALQKTLNSMKTTGSNKAKSAKAKAAAQLRKVRQAYISAAACRLGVHSAKARGQKSNVKCKKPPSRVGKSALVLGRQSAQKRGEKRYTTKQLMRNFLDPSQPLIK